ncbi:exonuclease 1-like isoform X1 [Tripterygium wilfordii]|uniref:exonuclease 1-like isoform X1 n=1 Tax=Tripterygium wilfordii TaxID=458696 RepID=UPI0018F841C3|nr:exonuclease 1-like isoform X1 [Tripterygium wilfordii]
MGIQGLLPLLKSIMVPFHIKDLEGCSVAVDTYSWLHKGALSCSRELCKGLPTSRHIEYCMHRVNLLRHYGIKPILVFDGGLLPMKIEQENKRARTRKENLARAIEHEMNGNSAAAYECYQKAVDISPLIAHELIQVLKQENVDHIVAPYEADAQMTFLAVSKKVDAVITEDSDLIPFGCPRIIFKMDKFGKGVEFRQSKLQHNKELSFAGFSMEMLLEMCIFSGCDYLQSLPGMGLKRAHALIKKFKCYDKVIKHLKYSTASVPPLYEESFKKAMLTFQHQRVYDPVSQDIVHLSEISDTIGDDLDFLGPAIPQHVAKGIAKGDLDPFTQMPFKGDSVNSELVLDKTSQFKVSVPESGRKKLELPVQNNLLTKYFCFASVEAKRKFRAPRTSPNHPNPAYNFSLTQKQHATPEAACNTNCSLVETLFATDDSEFSASTIHGLVDQKDGQDHTLMQQSVQPLYKPCQALRKEHDCKNAPVAVETKIRTDTRKVIVRSSYFQHKPVVENDQESEQAILLNKHDDSDTICENSIPENALQNYLKGTEKRKSSTDDSIQTENVQPKHMRRDTYLPDGGVCASDLEKPLADSKTEEGKFGCNISHLSHYSEIAEKSLERFVSVISSFKCPTSGSRASGLRPPLKDVRNTCSNRSTNGVDFSQFAYVPKSRKTDLAPRRR